MIETNKRNYAEPNSSAKYIGKDNDGRHNVHVKPKTVIKGNLGGAGRIESFESKPDALNYIKNSKLAGQPEQDVFDRRQTGNPNSLKTPYNTSELMYKFANTFNPCTHLPDSDNEDVQKLKETAAFLYNVGLNPLAPLTIPHYTAQWLESMQANMDRAINKPN